MFSEMMRMRPACARKPEAAMASVLMKSMSALLFLAQRHFDEAEAARVDGGRRLVVHLVGGDLHHLFFEIDRVAGRLDLVARFDFAKAGARAGKSGKMAALGAR